MMEPGDAPLDDERGGGVIPGLAHPAFTLRTPAGAPLPVLIAAPHGGRCYPPELLAQMRDPAFSALRLEDRHIDRIARAVAAETGAALLAAQAPRAMIDLNRAPDDMDWTMVAGGAGGAPARHSAANRRARSGLGLVPRRLPGIGEIWRGRLAREDLDARIAAIHGPYHAALSTTLESLRDRWGAALLIDLHSMPPLRAGAVGEPAAEIVIGDRFGASCDRSLALRAIDWLEGQDRAVAHNRPYAGGYVLDRHAAPRRGVHALQVEVCRSAYLDARFAEPSARAAGMVRLLAGMVRTLAQEIAVLGGSAALPLAAE